MAGAKLNSKPVHFRRRRLGLEKKKRKSRRFFIASCHANGQIFRGRDRERRRPQLSEIKRSRFPPSPDLLIFFHPGALLL